IASAGVADNVTARIDRDSYRAHSPRSRRPTAEVSRLRLARFPNEDVRLTIGRQTRTRHGTLIVHVDDDGSATAERAKAPSRSAAPEVSITPGYVGPVTGDVPRVIDPDGPCVRAQIAGGSAGRPQHAVSLCD